jgi:predicted cupin superfamily sugar epimerase
MTPPAPPTADEVIETLGLEPLPHEGGAFRETYRSATRVRPGMDAPERAASTQIYYLLRPGESSALHRVRSDEVFHHYLGDPVIQLRIDDGTETFGEPGAVQSASVVTIGPDLRAGQRPQTLAPRDVWQGSVLSDTGPFGFALMGCTVAPGFEWEDFELITPGRAGELARELPEHAGLIGRMTPVPGRTRA